MRTDTSCFSGGLVEIRHTCFRPIVMTRRIRNVLMFVAAVLGTGLLVIGIVSVMDGDESGWRAIIGGVLAFALVLAVGMRGRSATRDS